MITPNIDTVDLVDLSSRLLRNLAYRAVLIKTSQRCEILDRNGWRIVRANQGVCVRWVPNDANLDCLLGYSVKSGALCLEALCIGLEKIRAFHAGSSDLGAHKDCNIAVLKAN